MARVWEHEAVARRSRQWPALERLRAHVEVSPALAGMILVGSFARGEVDPLSDLDVVLVAPDGGFAAAWAAREELHADAALVCWDQRDPGFSEAGAHKWVTRDLVLVECLLATPTSGVRLARPAAVVAGDAGLVERFPARPQISRDELAGEPERLHEVERAYDQLKAAVRAAGAAGAAGAGATALERGETPETIEDESAPGA
jgi:nucleotidyltransferase-like protein